MTTYTVEMESNNIAAHATRKDAKAIPNSEHFNSAEQLAKLAANWPTARLIEIWNGIPGVTPVRKFTDRRAAATRIWKAIQSLGESIPTQGAVGTDPLTHEAPKSGVASTPVQKPKRDQPAPKAADQVIAVPGSEEFQPKAAASEGKADPGAQSPDLAPEEGKATKKATGKAKTPRGEMIAKTPRETSKTSRVIEMLKREGGTTLEELMTVMGWQKHTTRALLSAGGSLTKKHGLAVTSEKFGDKRTYFLNS